MASIASATHNLATQMQVYMQWRQQLRKPEHTLIVKEAGEETVESEPETIAGGIRSLMQRGQKREISVRERTSGILLSARTASEDQVAWLAQQSRMHTAGHLHAPNFFGGYQNSLEWQGWPCTFAYVYLLLQGAWNCWLWASASMLNVIVLQTDTMSV